MTTFGVGDARVDLTLRLVRDGSGERRLTVTEGRILEALAAAKGQPVSAERLIEVCWGDEGNASTLLSVLARLRRKLDPTGRHESARGPGPLRAIRNEGYVLDLGPGQAPLPGLARAALIGRDAELVQLDQRAHPGGFVTALGPPGAGKTTLARVLARTRALAGGAVVWCDLAPARTLADVVRVVAAATSAPIEGRLARQDAQTLAGWLGRFDLVVLDNGEPCLDALAEVALAWGAPTALVLTSRMPVGLAAERRVELGGLSREAARALFVRTASAISDAEPPSDDLIDRIVDRIDRLPLAIVLTASHVRLLDPQSLLERLDRPLALLQSTRRDLSDQHRAFRVALERSWELLPEDVTRALAGLSAFPASFDLTAAEAILELSPGGVLQAVLAGLDASLLRIPDGAEGERVAMLEVVREFADEQLAGEHRAHTFARHARWAIGVAEANLGALHGPGARAALDQLSALVPDLFAVARRAPTSELVVRAILAAHAVFMVRGPMDGMTALLDEAVTRARAEVPALLGATLFARGLTRERIGLDSESDLREALALAWAAGDGALAADCLSGLAELDRRTGRLAPGNDTLKAMAEAVALAGDPRRDAYLRIERGRAFLDADDLHAARAELSTAADALCALGDARRESYARLLHSIVLHYLGDAAARQEILRTLALAEATGDARAEIRARLHLGTTLLERDDAEAARVFTVALERARAIGAKPLVWMATIQRARALVGPDPAAALADLDSLAELEHPYEAVPHGYLRARALYGLGRLAEAEATLAALDPTPERDHEAFGYIHAMRAILRLEQGDLAGARAALAVRANDKLGGRALALAEARVARAEGVQRDPLPPDPLDRTPDLQWMAGR